MDSLSLKRRGQILAPSLFTMGNMACGFYSLLASHMGDFRSAAVAVLGGIAFDMLDGRVARMVRGESRFGVEFDSLSDFLSFGVAPAYMMYAFVLKDYGFLGGAVAFLFALCGGLRLARFNVASQSGKGSKTHFQGLPIPAGGGFLASFVLLYDILESQRPGRTLGVLMDQLPALVAAGPFLMVGLSLLMVSSVPYRAFKQGFGLRRRDPRLLVLAGALALIYLYPQNAVFLCFAVYALSGVLELLRRPRGGQEKAAGPGPEAGAG